MTMNTRHIAIYCVTYHSYDALNDYIASIEAATRNASEDLRVSLMIADNTDANPQAISEDSEAIDIHVLPHHENTGYFGAVKKLMEKYAPTNFDYAIISNVDVLLDVEFFNQLLSYNPGTDTGWIAPQIYSQLEQRDRNPKIMQRYAKKKLMILRALFRVPILYNLYTHTVYKSKKLMTHQHGDIYAGHGSFIILTKTFFQQCGIIDYPVFLFCEEIYLGEQCQHHGLKVTYEPSIKVMDAEHASTSTFKRARYCKYNYDAISYILASYYA